MSRRPPPPPPRGKKTPPMRKPPPPPPKGGEPTPWDIPSKSKFKFGPRAIHFLCTKGATEFNIIVGSNEPPIKFEGGRAGNATAEVVFLIDSSGSMGDEMEAVKRTCLDFSSGIAASGFDARMGLVVYDIGTPSRSGYSGKLRDLGQYNTINWGLLSAGEFGAVVNSELVVGMGGGGGCYVANPGTGAVFREVVSTFSSGKGAKATSRFVVHISDEIGDASKGSDMADILKTCKGANIVVHTMGCPGSGHTQISSETGGEFWDITSNMGVGDLSGILGEISTAISTSMLIHTTSKVASEGPRCQMISTSPVLAINQGNSRVVSTKGNDEEGWTLIRGFSCHYCQSEQYIICSCGQHLCAGGAEITKVSGNVKCATCGERSEIEHSTSGPSTVNRVDVGKK